MPLCTSKLNKRNRNQLVVKDPEFHVVSGFSGLCVTERDPIKNILVKASYNREYGFTSQLTNSVTLNQLNQHERPKCTMKRLSFRCYLLIVNN